MLLLRSRAHKEKANLDPKSTGYDEEAAEHLRKLDDDLKLKYKVRDMIDTTLYDASAPLDQYILKALLGGINRTIDKTN